jgi:hypothetical protein
LGFWFENIPSGNPVMLLRLYNRGRNAVKIQDFCFLVKYFLPNSCIWSFNFTILFFCSQEVAVSSLLVQFVQCLDKFYLSYGKGDI